MSNNATLFRSPTFVPGALRELRTEPQRVVAARAGMSAGTVSKAERGGTVKVTSALLLAIAAGILSHGVVYDLNSPKTRKVLGRYMCTTTIGRNPKGWAAYIEGQTGSLAA